MLLYIYCAGYLTFMFNSLNRDYDLIRLVNCVPKRLCADRHPKYLRNGVQTDMEIIFSRREKERRGGEKEDNLNKFQTICGF